jgi:hypothetical protein
MAEGSRRIKHRIAKAKATVKNRYFGFTGRHKVTIEINCRFGHVVLLREKHHSRRQMSEHTLLFPGEASAM